METYLNGRIIIWRAFYEQARANFLFDALLKEIKWLDKSYENPDGKIVHLPRLTANYGEKSYNYSGLTFSPETWFPLLSELKADAESLAGELFNALILQLYRDGHDGVNWHSDNDACVGQNPTILSMSFGETRQFWFKHKDKTKREEILQLTLQTSDVVLMQGTLQHTHLHTVPKEENKQARINLTFRRVL
jgi:alkylated DNA repair dioxygenase AlkB